MFDEDADRTVVDLLGSHGSGYTRSRAQSYVWSAGYWPALAARRERIPFLDWKAPSPGPGGRVRTYLIERREQVSGSAFNEWHQVAIALRRKEGGMSSFFDLPSS